MFNAIGALMLAGMLAKEPRCVKWTWTGDVYNRRVVCLEWDKPQKPPKDKEPKKMLDPVTLGIAFTVAQQSQR